LTAIVVAESVTDLREVSGKVLVAGSHGGIIAAYLGAKAGAHALILNDAGVGRDDAGIAGLAWLDKVAMAAAAVDYRSARIGNGADMLRRGIISHANRNASRVGVAPGQSCAEAAARLRTASPRPLRLPAINEGRYRLYQVPPEVWALDSVGKLLREDQGRILLIGSHGALHGGRRDSALAVAARAVVFNDAGVGMDRIGISRLPVLEKRGIPAATVDFMSARIGDGRSKWEAGVLSHTNAAARGERARAGETVRAFVARLLRRKTG